MKAQEIAIIAVFATFTGCSRPTTSVMPGPERTTDKAISSIRPTENLQTVREFPRPPQQARAIAEIEMRGGKIEIDEQSPGKPVIGVRLGGAKDVDAALPFLADLPSLRGVDLSVSKGAESVTDAGLGHLAEMFRLQHLNLANTRIGDKGLEQLQSLAALRSLDLHDTLVTDGGMRCLRGLTALQSLSLWGDHITDAGLAQIKGLTALEELDLGSTRVTAANLETLRGLTNLKHLDLRNTKVSDAGFEAVKKALPMAKIDFNKLGVIEIPEGGAAMKFEISTTAFQEGKPIPKRHTGDDKDLSPPVKWTDPPAGTKSFALIADDPDAPRGTWVHWVLFNLPPDTRSLDEGIPKIESLPNGAKHGKTDFGNVGYGGPSPPKGKPHRYFFKLYALDEMLKLPVRATKTDLEAAMKGHVLAEAQVMGTYQR